MPEHLHWTARPAQVGEQQVAAREARKPVKGKGFDHRGLPVANLLATVIKHGYSAEVVRVYRIQLEADAIDEPNHDGIAPLLEALNPEERAIYSDEANVVELDGTCGFGLEQFEPQYGSVGWVHVSICAVCVAPRPPIRHVALRIARRCQSPLWFVRREDEAARTAAKAVGALPCQLHVVGPARQG